MAEVEPKWHYDTDPLYAIQRIVDSEDWISEAYVTGEYVLALSGYPSSFHSTHEIWIWIQIDPEKTLDFLQDLRTRRDFFRYCRGSQCQKDSELWKKAEQEALVKITPDVVMIYLEQKWGKVNSHPLEWTHIWNEEWTMRLRIKPKPVELIWKPPEPSEFLPRRLVPEDVSVRAYIDQVLHELSMEEGVYPPHWFWTDSLALMGNYPEENIIGFSKEWVNMWNKWGAEETKPLLKHIIAHEFYHHLRYLYSKGRWRRWVPEEFLANEYAVLKSGVPPSIIVSKWKELMRQKGLFEKYEAELKSWTEYAKFFYDLFIRGILPAVPPIVLTLAFVSIPLGWWAAWTFVGDRKVG